MALTSAYDPNESLFSPSPEAAGWFLNNFNPASVLRDVLDLSPETQTGIDPSQTSNSSPPTSFSLFSHLPSIHLINSSSIMEQVDFSQMAQPTQHLRIVAQPKAFYRERYYSETDKNRNRAQRFIRAEENPSKFEYPTVEFADVRCNPNRQLYIRVALVTAMNANVPVVCVHPYAVDTQETNVIKDAENNSLYFPITTDEMQTGRKSFRITRKKMIQHELKGYGSLRIFDSDQKDIARLNNLYDAKEMIDTYQLWRSQLVFTIAEHYYNNSLPIPIDVTSISSQIMCDEVTGRRSAIIKGNSPTIKEEDIRYAPKKGDWIGGDEILMVIPRLDRRKALHLFFDYGEVGQVNNIEITIVDTKTITFRTPACYMLTTDRDAEVPIVVMQGDTIIAQVDFLYLAATQPAPLPVNVCSNCQLIDSKGSFKRRFSDLFEGYVNDDVTSLTSGIDHLDIGTTSMKPSCSTPSSPPAPPPADDKSSKFDKYLGQLQDAVVEFVRTNNPARLFRRTRLLLAKCKDDVPPLDEAIQRGHIELALALVEQVADMSATNGLLERTNKDGETPLLLAAKLNRWELIELILKKRSDLVRQVDKNENNLFHLLACISKDGGEETIKNVLSMLSTDNTTYLLAAKNQEDQTPAAKAEVNLNSQCADLLKNALSLSNND